MLIPWQRAHEWGRRKRHNQELTSKSAVLNDEQTKLKTKLSDWKKHDPAQSLYLQHNHHGSPDISHQQPHSPKTMFLTVSRWAKNFCSWTSTTPSRGQVPHQKSLLHLSCVQTIAYKVLHETNWWLVNVWIWKTSLFFKLPHSIFLPHRKTHRDDFRCSITKGQCNCCFERQRLDYLDSQENINLLLWRPHLLKFSLPINEEITPALRFTTHY